MNNRSTGTLELLAIEMANILETAGSRLLPGEVRALFAELGLQFPSGLEDQAGFLVALQNAVSAAAQLPVSITELITALEAEDLPLVLQKTAALSAAIRNLIERFGEVALGLAELSNAFPTIPPAQVSAFAAQLPRRLVDYLFITYLENRLFGVSEILEFWGIVERLEEQLDSLDPANPPFTRRVLHLDRLADFIASPNALLQTLFGWGLPTFDGLRLLERLHELLARLNFPSLYNPAAVPPTLNLLLAEISPQPDLAPPGLRIVLKTSIPQQTLEFEQDQWRFEGLAGIQTPAETALLLQPDGSLILVPPPGSGIIQGEARLSWTGKAPQDTGPFILLGESGGSRLEVGEVAARAEADFQWDPTSLRASGHFLVEAEIKEGFILIEPTGEDSFLQAILPADGIQARFDLGLGFSTQTGFFLRGSSALEARIPVHVKAGELEIQAVTIGIHPGSGKILVNLGGDLKTKLGPLTAVVENLGLTARFSFPEDNRGNLGPLQLDIGFKPPGGIGLSIDGGGFTGGGFLRYIEADQRYEGMLELEYEDRISLKAIGLLTTRLPGGQPGFSLLIIITAEFTPLQLGLGFTLNGVGGLLGLHRSANAERLRSGLRDNTLNSVLFPQNVIANASRILSDLNQVFPPQADRFIFGPMARLGWGTPTLLTIDLGLLVEIPDPVRVLILGVIRALLPDEKARLLQLQVNFLGVIDFAAQRLSIDASLYDSKLLSYTLSGDMAVRLSWGAEPDFLLTVGGFHPAYQPPPLNLPALRRLSLQLVSGDNPRLTLETYFAITSNTVQFGAKIELLAKAGSFSVYGFLSFDVLFQFNPFYFIAAISAKLALRAGSSEIASISLDFTLEGPTPWHAKGTAKLKICWFLTIKVRFDKTFGEARDTRLDDVAVLPLLRAALSDKGNWKAQPAGGRRLLVSIKSIQSAVDQVVVYPFGVLTIQQRVVPLGVEIQRFGSQLPADGERFAIEKVNAGEGSQAEALATSAVRELFAPAQFFELEDAQKLSSKSFERYDSGVRLVDSEAFDGEYAVRREVAYELFYIDAQRDLVQQGDPFRPDFAAFHSWALQGAVARSPLSHARNGKSALAPGAVRVGQEGYAVVRAGDLRPVAAEAQAASEAGAQQRMAELLREDPALEGEILVVPAFEVNRAL